MSLKRHAARRDANEGEIVRVLEQLGCKVYRLSEANLPDLLVRVAGLWLPVEVKTSSGRLSQGQQVFIEESLAAGAPAATLRSVDEAVALVTGLRAIMQERPPRRAH